MNAFFNRRRILGTACLCIAVAMLILGETLLKNRLSPTGTILFWMSCLLATSGAIVCALLDFKHSMRESRSAQRELLEDALREIEGERERRKRAPGTTPKSR